jgi:hypothetical protein
MMFLKDAASLPDDDVNESAISTRLEWVRAFFTKERKQFLCPKS